MKEDKPVNEKGCISGAASVPGAWIVLSCLAHQLGTNVDPAIRGGLAFFAFIASFFAWLTFGLMLLIGSDGAKSDEQAAYQRYFWAVLFSYLPIPGVNHKTVQLIILTSAGMPAVWQACKNIREDNGRRYRGDDILITPLVLVHILLLSFNFGHPTGN